MLTVTIGRTQMKWETQALVLHKNRKKLIVSAVESRAGEGEEGPAGAGAGAPGEERP